MDPDCNPSAAPRERETGAAASTDGRPHSGILTSGQHQQQTDPAGLGRGPPQGNEESPPGPPGP
eukprot:8449897-Heterocapsa_arctica.AAC.1